MTQQSDEPKDTRFKPGQSGNPAGRPKGARAKLGEAFLEAMYADFKDHGAIVISDVRTKKPDKYLSVIASILPKELTGEDGAPLTFAVIERHIVDPANPDS